MPPGAKLLVSGKLDVFNGRLTIAASGPCGAARPGGPAAGDRAGLAADRRPVAAPGGHAHGARRWTWLPDFPEWHDPALLSGEKWPPFAEALRAVQAPATGEPGPPACGRGWPMTNCSPARWRWALMRGRVRARSGQPLIGDGALRDKALERFGFPPTASQEQALAEIDADLASPRRMLRLLQGDVGSGKTLVALLAMLRAVEAGAQAALMAPTEVLAKQHHRTLSHLCPVPVALLTGSVKGKERGAAAARDQGRVHPDRRRHPRAVPGRGRVSRPGGGGDRRAAPVRRRPAADCSAARASTPTCW